jgi:hypothetical protein
MPIIIDGTGTISGISATNGLSAPQTGSVLQVVQGTYATQVGSSSSTLADTGLTASITPKFTTSKILVFVTAAGCFKESNNTGLRLALLRNSTFLANLDIVAGYTGTTASNGAGSCAINYLDSPATISSTTYKLQISSSANLAAVYINALSGGNNGTSTITLMEIAG